MRKVIAIGVLTLMGMCLCSANAALLELSTHVSDGATPPQVVDLWATLEFSVNGAGDELYVTVSNLTDMNPSGNEYSISEIFFNTPDSLFDVESSGRGQDPGDGLVLTDFSGSGLGNWLKTTEYSRDAMQINGFGDFDMRIVDGGQQVIGPGETGTFTFTINGSGTPYTANDFVSLWSVNAPEGMEMLAGAKFEQGPGDASGFGVTNIPEPATIAILGFGVLVMLRKRKA